MTMSRDFTDFTARSAAYDDLERLWRLDHPTQPVVRRRSRRQPDRLMAIAWCSALSVMSLTFATLQWGIQAVGR
jgi:hypothetical protein